MEHINYGEKKGVDMSDPKLDPRERAVMHEFLKGKIEKSETHRLTGKGYAMGLAEALHDSLKHPVISEFFGSKEKFVEKAFSYLSPAARQEMVDRIERLEDQYEMVDLPEGQKLDDYLQTPECTELFWFLDRWYRTSPEAATKYLNEDQQPEVGH